MNDKNHIIELSQETIDKIAAGEVVERPASIVKELVENAIDADATAITVEIQNGGSTLIRITDNGIGIGNDEVRRAFLRHATSKIQDANDLKAIHSLGFRGEALSSIAAVSKVEMITKRKNDVTATHYIIEGGREESMREIGAPDGTSMFVRQIFYNTPARRKFLKSPMTEGNYITEIVERLALSHPAISFRFISNGQEKINTAGNGNLRDTIYEIYGKSIVKELIKIDTACEEFGLYGYIAAPGICRGNRAFESCFVGGRFIRSRLLTKAIDEGYKGYLMSRMYPFCVLNYEFAEDRCDVNVHPTKQDVRFFDEQRVYDVTAAAIGEALKNREDINEATLSREAPVREAPVIVSGAEPFEENRLMEMKQKISDSIRSDSSDTSREFTSPSGDYEPDLSIQLEADDKGAEQISFLSEVSRKKHRIVGEVFDTFWIVEYENSMYIIDQHAAHEKVLYERFMEDLKHKEMTSQQVAPPVIVTLSLPEEQAIRQYDDTLRELGFGVSHFGGKEYAIDAIPGNLYNIDPKELFLEAVSLLASGNKPQTKELASERVASMSCKAAVKANDHLSYAEAQALIDELLTLENPYHCPHGRPTIISMSKYELDRKFKRIV